MSACDRWTETVDQYGCSDQYDRNRTYRCDHGKLRTRSYREYDRRTGCKRQPELSAHEITVISSDKDQTCIFVVCLKTETERLEEALRAEGFTRMSYFSKRTPENKIKKYRLTIEGMRMRSRI